MVTPHELEELRALLEQRSGILFEGAREHSFSAKVRDHVQARRLAHGSELLRSIRTSNVEYDAFLERVLTQETSFFRYPDVFDALEKRVLPELRDKKFRANPRALRIWCAGCATGEEPYSIAITVADALPSAETWDVSILATDVSRQALRVAEAGEYPHRAVQALAPQQVEVNFSRQGDRYTVKPRVRNLVAFAPMNLAQAVYLGRFDCIFCMNVLIYFSAARRAEVIQRFYESLEPGGYLFLGHAETVNGAAVKFDTVVHRDARVYRKPAGTNAASAAGKERP